MYNTFPITEFPVATGRSHWKYQLVEATGSVDLLHSVDKIVNFLYFENPKTGVEFLKYEDYADIVVVYNLEVEGRDCFSHHCQAHELI